MPLSSLIVKRGATAMTPTAGTDVTFTPDGVVVTRGVHVADASEADFRIRQSMMFQNRNPALNSDGTYTKDKKVCTITKPKILATGKVVFNVLRIEREIHPESTAAEALDFNMLGAQVLSDSDVTAFWASGSLA